MIYSTKDEIFSIPNALIIDTFENETIITLDSSEVTLTGNDSIIFLEKFNFLMAKLPTFLQFGNKFLNIQRLVSVKNSDEGVTVIFNNNEEILLEDEEGDLFLDAIEQLAAQMDANMLQMMNAPNN